MIHTAEEALCFLLLLRRVSRSDTAHVIYMLASVDSQFNARQALFTSMEPSQRPPSAPAEETNAE